MSAVSVGPLQGPDELDALVAVLNRTYLRNPEEGKAWRDRVDHDELRVVRKAGRVAGGASLLPMAQWFGGRPVSMAGVGSVGIDPEHRAGGLASALMRGILEELHERGVALSTLYPATQPVYRRVGYELAGTFTSLTVECAAIDLRDRALPLRRVEAEDAEPLIGPLYARRAAVCSGHLERSQAIWRRVFSPDRGELHVYTVGSKRDPEGYVIFTQSRDDGWKYKLQCRDLVVLTPAASRRLWTFFADHRSFADAVVFNGSPSDAMLYALREQHWKAGHSWTWMLRLVDVRGALTERGYPPGLEAEVHLEVRDDVLPWNDGRFVLEVSGGAGRVRKGGRGRVRADVRGLASMYTGFAAAGDLTAAGHLEGGDKDLAAASAVFAGPAPWLPDFF